MTDSRTDSQLPSPTQPNKSSVRQNSYREAIERTLRFSVRHIEMCASWNGGTVACDCGLTTDIEALRHLAARLEQLKQTYDAWNVSAASDNDPRVRTLALEQQFFADAEALVTGTDSAPPPPTDQCQCGNPYWRPECPVHPDTKAGSGEAASKSSAEATSPAMTATAAAVPPSPSVASEEASGQGSPEQLQSSVRIQGVTWLLIRDGCVLLERCSKKARVLGVGEWFVPGGKVDGNETLEQALRREIREEWPWAEVYDAAPLPLLEGSPVPPAPRRGLFLMRPFVVTVAGVPDEKTPEGTPLRWFPIVEALASPVPQVRMMVAAAAAIEALNTPITPTVVAEKR